MLKKKAIRKMIVTTMSVFIILMLYLIPTTSKERTLHTNLELEYITGIGNNHIYLMNDNGYLVRTKILLDEKTKEAKIKMLLSNLTMQDSSKFPIGLHSTIPKGTKVEGIKLEEDFAVINFSKELLSVEKSQEKRMIESIVHSVLDIEGIRSVSIQVEGKTLKEYPNSLEKLPEIYTKNFAINQVFDIDDYKNTQKVVIYYLEQIENENYYVPVTKYLNDSREKVEIVVDELTSNYIYEPNLMSLAKEDVELISHEIDDDLLILNFNESFLQDGKIKEEVLYTFAMSCFDNYNINTISFQVGGVEKALIQAKDIP